MLSEEAPLTTTEPSTIPSIATAANAESVASTAKIHCTIGADGAGRADGDVVRAHEIAPRERSKRRTTVWAATL